MREHRGDAHFSVLQSEGLSPVEATVLGAVYTSSSDFLRRTRGWNEREWSAATKSLVDRGWLTSGELTPEGEEAREQIELRTDILDLSGWRELGIPDTARLLQLVTPLAEAVRASGTVPGHLGNLASHRSEQGCRVVADAESALLRHRRAQHARAPGGATPLPGHAHR
jgi:hypothetical protein